ncbi:hypothetical protein HDC94_002178 [Leifsonia sp. AK011]|uniref:hypothetical protein n=1 Tax=Leifsonia sp. AK011 TaxID=2723075 RepID=UPI0015CDEBBB|nr:hypothetical protein [Leifsonia sp. AK011]NYF11022.1 hypothetical protein [Leifsonia sp. AK011]
MVKTVGMAAVSAVVVLSLSGCVQSPRDRLLLVLSHLDTQAVNYLATEARAQEHLEDLGSTDKVVVWDGASLPTLNMSTLYSVDVRPGEGVVSYSVVLYGSESGPAGGGLWSSTLDGYLCVEYSVSAVEDSEVRSPMRRELTCPEELIPTGRTAVVIELPEVIQVSA